ncbi:hypothetical protein OS493_025117 [Desmophyllum pertusum]|uniref:Uncharacterized protein n=1 Tax=Desmophyllum pertusum TaxID=174260 RepID=A0A9X0D9C3_9CNID|nr:hypothetical protein OS493_025117 [Desmophyllum pertusum]
MRTKDGDSRAGLFESTKDPRCGVLMSKTVVDGDKKGGFWVKAVNLSDENVTLFKTRKLEFSLTLMIVQKPFQTWLKETDCPTVSYLADDQPGGSIEELGIDLMNSNLSNSQNGDLKIYFSPIADVFSEGKRDIEKYTAGVQHLHSPES